MCQIMETSISDKTLNTILTGIFYSTHLEFNRTGGIWLYRHWLSSLERPSSKLLATNFNYNCCRLWYHLCWNCHMVFWIRPQYFWCQYSVIPKKKRIFVITWNTKWSAAKFKVYCCELYDMWRWFDPQYGRSFRPVYGIGTIVRNLSS